MLLLLLLPYSDRSASRSIKIVMNKIQLTDVIGVVEKEKRDKQRDDSGACSICHIIPLCVSLKFEFNSVVEVVVVYALHIFCPFSYASTKCVRIHACKIQIAHTHKHSAANQTILCDSFSFIFCSKLGK